MFKSNREHIHLMAILTASIILMNNNTEITKSLNLHLYKGQVAMVTGWDEAVLLCYQGARHYET